MAIQNSTIGGRMLSQEPPHSFHDSLNLMKNALKALLILLAVSAPAIATMYRWPPQHKPRLDLSKAYDIAIKKLAQIEKYRNLYCVDAQLCGNEAQDGKEGAWNFSFTSSSNSLVVTVELDGDTSIQD